MNFQSGHTGTHCMASCQPVTDQHWSVGALAYSKINTGLLVAKLGSCNHRPGFSHVYDDCVWVRVMQRVCMFLFIHWVLFFILLVHAAKVEQVKFDTTQLHARPELAAEQRMVDDASGEIEVR